MTLSIFSWSVDQNFKQILAKKEDAKEAFEKGIVCYFGPDRYEKPFWQGDKYFNENTSCPSNRNNITGELKNPISIKNANSTNTQWVIDVLVDSRSDIITTPKGGHSLSPHTLINMITSLKTRNIIEQILSCIFNKDVFCFFDNRKAHNTRLRIVERTSDSIVSPSLNSLSTGQIALFNLFSTLVMYADNNNIIIENNTNNITGIVVIDEVELHLHSKMQKEILPKLIKLFPKVQFVITSHSPLFLLGMQEVFGDEGFEIYNMPDAKRIDVERFSEFQRAYEYFKNTTAYQKDEEVAIRSAINTAVQRDETQVLVITEGASDWKHMKAAYASLSKNSEHKDLFNQLFFSFLEYEPENSKEENVLKLNMGNTNLKTICESLAKIPQTKKYIFIADRDDENTNKKLSVNGQRFKDWGNNVYSFILPIPKHRQTTPGVCIEHLYSDEEIKTEIECNGIKRRLYIGYEFDDRGMAYSINRFCENKNCCGTGRIRIIEGSSGGRVTSLKNEDGTNYALPKMDFANYVAEHPDDFSFDSFLEIFKIIKEIVSKGEDNA